MSHWFPSTVQRLLHFIGYLLLVSDPSRAQGSSAYLTEWGLVQPGHHRDAHQDAVGHIHHATSGTGRLSQPACVTIPENLTLCRGIGYNQMRLPNLLEHDTMAEVSQQATSWIPLYNLKCHPDTQLFLCSLFTPVCLDRLIYPCRSLCDAVRLGCEGRMRNYGFPWPDMVKCDKFPVDNDMCIGVQSTSATASCTVCQQPETYENIIDNYCRADFVIKTRVKRVKKSQLKCKKAKVLKLRDGISKKDFRRPTLQHRNFTSCCANVVRNVGKKGRLLIMGIRGPHGSGSLNQRSNVMSSQSPGGRERGPAMGAQEEEYLPTFIMEWGKTKDFRKAVKMMSKIDCSNPKLLSETMISDGGAVAPRKTSTLSPGSAKVKQRPNRNENRERKAKL